VFIKSTHLGLQSSQQISFAQNSTHKMPEFTVTHIFGPSLGLRTTGTLFPLILFIRCFLAKLANLKVFNDQQLFFYLHYQSLIKYQSEENCHKFLFSPLTQIQALSKQIPIQAFQTIPVTWSLHEADLK